MCYLGNFLTVTRDFSSMHSRGSWEVPAGLPDTGWMPPRRSTSPSWLKTPRFFLGSWFSTCLYQSSGHSLTSRYNPQSKQGLWHRGWVLVYGFWFLAQTEIAIYPNSAQRFSFSFGTILFEYWAFCLFLFLGNFLWITLIFLSAISPLPFEA